MPTGATVGYGVTVQNTGTDSQANVRVRIRFPGVLWGMPVSGPGANCTFEGGGGAPASSITCTGGQVAGGASRVFAVQIKTPPSVKGGLSERYTITSELDVNGEAAGSGGADATATIVTSVTTLPDLDPQVSGPITGSIGLDLHYVVRVRNTGDRNASNVIARITLPRETDCVRLEQNTFQSCLPTGQVIGCSASAGIPPGGEASVRVVVRPLTLVGDGTTMLLSVNADPFGAVYERNETNSTAFIVTTMRAPADLEITATLEKKDVQGAVQPGNPPLDTIVNIVTNPTYLLLKATVTIRNLGPGQSPATTVRADWGSMQDPNSMCPAGTFFYDFGNHIQCRAITGYSFNSAPAPGLAPGTTRVITLAALTKKQFNVNMVEFGSVTIDPNHLVFDPNFQNNIFWMK